VLSEAVFVLTVVVVVIVIEEIMQFGYEQLDVYRVSLEYALRESWGLTAITTTTTTTITANSKHNESQSRNASDM